MDRGILMVRLFARTIAAVLIVAFSQGCGSSRGPVETWQTAGMIQKNLCRIAVLPAVNQSELSGVGPMVQKIFINSLIRRGDVQVIPEGDVQQFLFRFRLLPGDLMHQRQFEEMAAQLRLDALIRINVIDLGTKNIENLRDIPFVSFEAELLEASSGQMICKAFHRRQGDDYRKTMHFGVIRTLSGLIERASEEVIDDWKEKGIIGCSRSSKK